MNIHSVRAAFRQITLLVGSIRLIPHLILWRASRNRELIGQDVARWRQAFLSSWGEPSLTRAFLILMHHNQAFRALFYERLGPIRGFVRFLCPPLPLLEIACPKIGPGLVIQHGFATIILAKEIGANCWINQQVTIGGQGRGLGHPTLGDNVSVGAGAKVLGPVTIGDNSRIGANAVVVKNVPPNVTVVGVPAYIVRRDGRKVNEPL